MKPLHLIRRFFRSLLPTPVDATDEEWVASVLTADELVLWQRQPRGERSYSIRVARRAAAGLAGTKHADDDRWLAAALLHDVGKVDAGLRTPGRVVATTLGIVVPPVRRTRGRIGRYLRHPEIGAEMIRAAGGREEAARWAAVHHDPSAWTAEGVPAVVGDALAAADNA
jgi:putative nucleotidyltransferase with HDIG domain